ncbi:MAG: FHA domain-containing protein [Crocinitomicaceae bacterium]|nr:FHA domain-containing protein [Crocinitomicaceae bacterium]
MKLLLHHNNQTHSIALIPGQEITIGRDYSNFSIQNKLVSRNHLVLKEENNVVYFKDVSTNGSFLNGTKVKAQKWLPLAGKDKLALVKDTSIFIQLAVGAEKVEKSTGLLMDLLKQKSLVTIGRSNSCDIVLNERQISRKHASIERIGAKYFITDHSLNGTFVNGKRIIKKQELKHEDVLMIGLHQFSISQATKDFSKEIAISANDISLTFSNGTIGFHSASFSITKEKMVALMGPSGCGKSTLMQLLNGVYSPSSGDVKLFGLSVQSHFELMKQFIGYVPQENIVHEDLTIDEALFYTAKLRLGSHFNQSELDERINEVLGILNIQDAHLRTQPIKKLSGGQKKRVCIAVELLTQPKILFLDEPTSPLDPETIEEFLKSLRKLCELGTTVVMVTHKPEDLSFMDEVVFMGKGGYLVYHGGIDTIQQHFDCERLPQVYKKVSDAKEAQSFYQKFTKSKLHQKTAKQETVKQLETTDTAFFYQFWWLFRRFITLKINNKQNLFIALAQPLIIAFLILLVFPHLTENYEGLKKGNIGVLFITALSIIWFGISNSAKEIVGEKAIFKREHFFNLAILPYLLSKTTVLFLLTSLQTFLFLGIIKLGFPSLSEAGLQFIFLAILGLSAVCFGLLLSAWSKTTEAVMTMLPVALIPQIVLAGIVQPLENKLTETLSYFSLGRWGTEGLARIQDRSEQIADAPFLQLINANLYANTKQLEVASIHGNALILLLLSLFFLIFTYLKLRKEK